MKPNEPNIQKLYNMFDAYIEDVDKQSSVLPKILYHYTNVNGLKGIIESSKFWATHYSYLNDPTEIIYAKDLFKKELSNLLNIEHDPMCKQIIENILKRRKDLENMNVHGLEYIFYIVSFTEDGDSLSQWRFYGQNGRGYVIGINPNNVDYDHRPVKTENNNLKFIKLIYDQDLQIQIVRDSLNKFFDFIKDVNSQPNYNLGHLLTAVGSTVINYLIPEISLRFKHPSFLNENEWRAISIRPAIKEESNLEEVQFRTSENGIVPYIELDFSDKNAKNLLPLKKIRLGYQNNFENNSSSIGSYLRKLGYEDLSSIITKSNIPFV